MSRDVTCRISSDSSLLVAWSHIARRNNFNYAMVTARVRYASLSHHRLPETHAIAIFVWLALFYGRGFFWGGESLHVFCGRRNTSEHLNISLSFSRGRHSYVVVSWIAVNKHDTMSKCCGRRSILWVPSKVTDTSQKSYFWSCVKIARFLKNSQDEIIDFQPSKCQDWS